MYLLTGLSATTKSFVVFTACRNYLYHMKNHKFNLFYKINTKNEDIILSFFPS